MQESRLQKLLAFLEEEPNDPFVKYALATEYLKLNDEESALQYFQDLITNHPEYSGTYYHLAKLYESLNQPDAAIDIYQRGMNITNEQKEWHALSELKAAYFTLVGPQEDDFDE